MKNHILLEAPIKLVSLGDIEQTEGPFCMSFKFELDPLIRSVKEWGLVNPLIVKGNDKGMREVVLGFRRLLALKTLGLEEIPCKDITNTGFSDLDCLLLNLKDNLATRYFNDVEKAMVLSRLSGQVPKNEILMRFMPLLGLPSHKPTFDFFLEIASSDETLKVAIVEKRLSAKAFKSLLDLNARSRSSVVSWILSINLNSKQQLQFIEYLQDISMRDECSVHDLLLDEDLINILNDANRNSPQKAKAILRRLKSRRFPMLDRSEKAYRKYISSLDLPKGARIHHPPFFEGSEFRLDITFKKGGELKEKLEYINRIQGLEKISFPWEEEESNGQTTD